MATTTTTTNHNNNNVIAGARGSFRVHRANLPGDSTAAIARLYGTDTLKSFKYSILTTKDTKEITKVVQI
jgi:hypothetical protein